MHRVILPVANLLHGFPVRNRNLFITLCGRNKVHTTVLAESQFPQAFSRPEVFVIETRGSRFEYDRIHI